MTDPAQIPSMPVTVETLPVLAHEGQRVVTTSLLAQLYGAEARNIQDNFIRNAERFEPGKHYIKLEGAALRAFKHYHAQSVLVTVPPQTRHFILWTERGAARHAKMLDTNAAWDVFERLEDAYFRAGPPVAQAPLPALAPPPDPVTPEIRAAIDRKVMQIAMHAMERNRITLEAWVRSGALAGDVEALLAEPHVRDLGLDHGQKVLVDYQDLWGLTTALGRLEMAHAQASGCVRRIEAETGLKLGLGRG